MAPLTFLWHDYETFGVEPRRDRPAQFAAIRTDTELNEIGEPIMLYCRPAPDYLPDPQSCLLTGITPQLCLARGVPEHVFAAAIETAFAASGTIGVGYNTIRFDDEVTRFLFWRNLIDPYGREWQNSCGRWDILDMVRAAYALRPQGIAWPTHADGKPSFRLEDLCAANGLSHDCAHDALSDVRATIGLARRDLCRLRPCCSDDGGRCPRLQKSLRTIPRGAARHYEAVDRDEQRCRSLVVDLSARSCCRNLRI